MSNPVKAETPTIAPELIFDQLHSGLGRLEIEPQFVDPHALAQTIPFLEECLDNLYSEDALYFLIRMAQSQSAELKEKAVKVMSNNIGRIEYHLDPSKSGLDRGLDVMRIVSEQSTSDMSRRMAKERFENALKTLYEELNSLGDPRVAIEHLIQHGNPEQVAAAEAKLMQIIKNLGGLSRGEDDDYINGKGLVRHPLFNLLETEKATTLSSVYIQIFQHLRDLGLDPAQLIDEWKVNCERYEFTPVLLFNLATINDLEKAEKGLAGKLQKTQNIVHFGRYPVEFLQDQFTEIGDRRQAIAIVAQEEEGQGAFYNWYAFRLYQKLFQQLGKKYKIRLVEVGPRKEDFTRFVSNHGEVGAADFGIIQIHAHHDHFGLGRGEHGKQVNITAKDFKEDPHNLGLDRIRQGGLLLLNACESGKLSEAADKIQAIGQELSEICQITTIGPEEPAGIKDIEFSVNPLGELEDIKPQYVYATMEYITYDPDLAPKSVKAHKFQSGKVIY